MGTCRRKKCSDFFRNIIDIHEVLAEFGTQEKGVFPKDKLDSAMNVQYYAYNELKYDQKIKCERENLWPEMLIYDKNNLAPFNPFRTMGIDWDKYGASSSIIILEYDVIIKKFKVIKRVEVPRSEYSYDNAINMIVELNDIYNPSFIYCDAGSGEYQIERLHIIGDQRPSTGLKNKVKRWQFAQSLDIRDPITFELTKQPLKPFMVNQLTLAFERDNIILSPFDDVLHKQLVNYEVEKINNTGKPIYTSKDEHFIDALGLAYLAMVLEFKELTNVIKEAEVANKIEFSNKSIGSAGINRMFNSIQSSYSNSRVQLKPSDDLPGDKQKWVKVSQSYNPYRNSSSWGSRSSSRESYLGRSMW